MLNPIKDEILRKIKLMLIFSITITNELKISYDDVMFLLQGINL